MNALTITLTDEQAACLWDDVTWGGQHHKPLLAIIQDYINDRAAVAVRYTPPSILPAVIEKFRAANYPARPAPTNLPEDHPLPASMEPLT